ncbi:pyridoxamine 5'-phosphate oxidase family protein [Methylomonas sp. CM2]|uniref:pyridoxamine 5'-phosphate oxidase family protein n=1 Tax=Methylomonas sp. CM2 TaxID=3417647 RepID=UPI003CF79CEE
MNSPQPDAECLALIARLDSLMLATRSEQHHAEASYAPFLFDRGAFHIFVSALASHTGNLLTHRRAGVLLIEPEADAANPLLGAGPVSSVGSRKSRPIAVNTAACWIRCSNAWARPWHCCEACPIFGCWR